MDAQNRTPTACVLCRSCVNYLGRPDGRERRRDRARMCAAQMVPPPGALQCESYVRSQAPRLEALGRPRAGPAA